MSEFHKKLCKNQLSPLQTHAYNFYEAEDFVKKMIEHHKNGLNDVLSMMCDDCDQPKLPSMEARYTNMAEDNLSNNNTGAKVHLSKKYKRRNKKKKVNAIKKPKISRSQRIPTLNQIDSSSKEEQQYKGSKNFKNTNENIKSDTSINGQIVDFNIADLEQASTTNKTNPDISGLHSQSTENTGCNSNDFVDDSQIISQDVPTKPKKKKKILRKHRR